MHLSIGVGDMRLVKTVALAVLAISLAGCGSDLEEIYLSGTVDLENVRAGISGPVMLAVTNTADLAALEASPETSIVGAFGIDGADPYYHVDLGQLGLKSGETVYLFAFVDNDFNNIPSPGLGDFIGFYINRKTYKLDYTLKKGENRNLDISVNRQLRDFDATIVYAIDKGDVNYGDGFNILTTEEVVLAVHEDGVQTSLTSSGSYDIKIDPDYILGFSRFQPPEFDYAGALPRPVSLENPRILEILPAIHVKIFSDDKIDGGVYLFAIIDENSNGEIEADDDVGYYNTSTTIAPGTCYDVPGYGEVCPPAGTYYYPKAIEVSKGENRDTSTMPANEPYWIMYQMYKAP
jgi:hypothetical protein